MNARTPFAIPPLGGHALTNDDMPLDVGEWKAAALTAGITVDQMRAQWRDQNTATQRAWYRAMMAEAVPLVDTTHWIGRTPPPRRWVVDEWLARGTGGIFVGLDGVGKSLLSQQLVTCVAAAIPFLGLDVQQMPAFYLTCEDDERELWRRQRGINRALGLPLDASPAILASKAGDPNTFLGTFAATGEFEISNLFRGIAETARANGAGLLVLDNIAHLFTGNENVRREVASFCAAVDKLAMDLDAAVLAIGHPPKAAGVEFSGSTGWSAHMRQRWFMERPSGDGYVDKDVRLLRKSKANYSSTGDEVRFYWHDGAFITERDLPPDRASEMAAAAEAGRDNAIFLACLAERTKQERAVSEKASKSFAPTVFARMPHSKGIGKERLEAAMDRLFALEIIKRGLLPWRSDRKEVHGLMLCANECANAAPTLCADAPDASAPTLSTHTHP